MSVTLIAEFGRDDLSLGVQFMAKRSVVVWLGEDGTIRATRNRCAHQGGRFNLAGGCVVSCPHHGWVLDVSTMAYTNPTNGQKQPELKVREVGGWVQIYEGLSEAPWGSAGDRQVLQPHEFSIRFHAHAAAEIALGEQILFTDPWLLGPAFLRGWWLIEPPPDDALDRLAAADAIYISHNHSDHLNPATLARLAERRTDSLFLVPPFESCVQQLRALGFSNIEVVPFDTWYRLGAARLMLLRDGTTREDSGLLVEYKGHRVLNTVDCSDLNGGHFPEDVDVLLMSFAGGASGYPACWTDGYTDEEIDKRIRLDRTRIRTRIVETVRAIGARIFVPFAGYFTEAHPADADVRARNWKNSPDIVIADVERDTDAVGWRPVAGASLDVGTGSVADPDVAPSVCGYDFDRYIKPFEEAMHFAPLQSVSGLIEYFRWTGFTGDLLLHIVETDEAFEEVFRDVKIDLSGPRVVSEVERESQRYLRMRVRADVFRHVLRHGLAWEELTIGFCARFKREPDIYNMDFWSHFQDKLPERALWS